MLRFEATVGILCLLASQAFAAGPGDYLENGKLKHPLIYSNVQLGGFAGRLETTVRIEQDGSWSSEFGVGGRKEPKKGKLTEAQLGGLAALLAEQDLAGLPAVIGSAKPVKSPRQIADGASTTFTIEFGEKKVVANFADGVEVDEETARLRQRLFTIGNLMRTAASSAAE